MPRPPKSEEIKVRVSAEMKEKITQLSAARGESESLIVREALLEYLSNLSHPHRSSMLNEPPAKYGATKKDPA